jgi:uncharacterized damage-inducible protein DinB
MSSKHLIAEIDFEMTSTTKLLERVPEEKLTWKPHQKAMTLGQLAFHVASIPGNYLSFADEAKTDLEILTNHYIPGSKKEIMESFSESIATAKQILEKGSDEWFAQNWELIKNGQCIFSIPRLLMCRLLVLNHWYHHRGELVTYLRTLDVLIPSVYGPSADENPFA